MRLECYDHLCLPIQLPRLLIGAPAIRPLRCVRAKDVRLLILVLLPAPAASSLSGKRRMMIELINQWKAILRARATDYARVALTNIAQECPSDVHQVMQAPGDFPHRPRARTPVFYGSFDWHSCVEMHWLLVRLLRSAADCVPEQEIRASLDQQFTFDGLAAEAQF